MAEAKHTSGPWMQFADTNIVICRHSGSKYPESLRICEVATNTRGDEGRHNLRLIAAAPELLSLLQDAVESFGPHIEGGDDEWLKFARATIAKATGEHHD